MSDDTRIDRNAALRRATAETTARAYREERTLESLVDILSALLINADLLISMLIEQRDSPQPACAPGCSFCCRRPVYASFAELTLIYCYIRETWSAEEVAAFRRQLELVAATPACPLLDVEQGLCRVYPARPLSCRATHSFSAPSCEADQLDIDIHIQIPQRLEVLAAIAALQAGFMDGLSENGGQDRLMPLGENLARIFAHPASILAFLDGAAPGAP